MEAAMETFPVENEKVWNKLPPDELSVYAQRIFDHYRNVGFPYYRYTEDELRDEYKKLAAYDYSGIIVDGVIRQTMHGLGLAWSYFPHSWAVPCVNYPTPMEVYLDDTRFMTTIEKRLKYGSFISDAGIRKALRTYNHVQSVSNFRPSAAAAIYQYAAKRLGKDKISTWDMSGGFGGRLLGAFASNAVDFYAANDPSMKTWGGLCKMSHDIKHLLHSPVNTLIADKGSEVRQTQFSDKQQFDLAFTSPPYFNTERYSDDDAQSYIAYPTYPEWRDEFLAKTIDNVNLYLNATGLFIINVANVKTASTLEKDTLQIASDKGFKLVDTLKLALSNRSKDFKYEPVFVFEKR